MENDEELEMTLQKKMEHLKGRAQEAGGKGSAPAKPIELSKTKFEEITQKHPLVVVDCWAAWCPPCSMIAPIIDEMAREHAGRIVFGKLNVDENREIAGQFEIMSIPTLLVFKNGKLVDRIVGAMPKKVLEPKIKRHL